MADNTIASLIPNPDDLSLVNQLLKENNFLKLNNLESIINIKQEELTNTNNSVGSILKKIIIKFKSQAGDEIEKHMVLKSKRVETGPQDVTEILGAFPNEVKLYGEVIPCINKLLETENIYKPWPEFYGHKGNNILLEDLTVSGYKIKANRQMDYDHAKLSIKELGKYHAMTLVIVERGMVDPTWFKPCLYARHLPFIIELNKSAFNGLVNSMRLHWGPEWHERADKIVKISQNIGDTLHELWHSTKGQHDVINHGEFWLNNLIYKYDEEGKVKQVKILDFQVSHYNSPVWDLAIFLFGSVNPVLRVKSKDSLIKTYYESLMLHLIRFDYKGYVPSLTYIEHTLDEIWIFAFLAAITAPPWLLAAAKEGIKHEDDTAGKELLESFHMPCYQWQSVRDQMKKEVEYWVNKGKL